MNTDPLEELAILIHAWDVACSDEGSNTDPGAWADRMARLLMSNRDRLLRALGGEYDGPGRGYFVWLFPKEDR